MRPYPTPPPGGGLYVIWLSETHYYGGRTKCFRTRLADHHLKLRKGKHHNSRVQRVFDKYGGFRPEYVSVDAEDDYVAAEQRWLDEHHGRVGCLNLARSARGTDEVSQKARGNYSKAKKGRKLSEEHKRNLSRARMGVRPSEETRRKLSESRRGKKHSEETRAKMAASHRKRHALAGGHSEETKAKIAATKTPEVRRRVSEKLTGRKLSPKTRRRMSEAAKRRARED